MVSLVTFFQKADDYNSDLEMIKAIKEKLVDLNKQESERSNNHPEFEWKCHKECLWICLKLMREEERLDC